MNRSGQTRWKSTRSQGIEVLAASSLTAQMIARVQELVDLIAPLCAQALSSIATGTATFSPQDRDAATFFHKRTVQDSLIDWNWPAEDIERLVRAQSDPYPNAFTFFNGQRIRILKSHVSQLRYGGTPGRVFYWEHDAMVIVAGADARYGKNRGLGIDRIRLDDGTEQGSREFFPSGDGYLSNGV